MGKRQTKMPLEKERSEAKDAPKPTEKKIEITYNTRFLAPPHEEIDAAAHLLRQKFPDLAEELLNECLTDRLNTDGFNKGTVVYVVVRKSYGRKRMKDAQTYREAPDGARITVHTPVEELAGDMKVYGPICAKDHWTESERGWHSELDRASFLEELGKLAAPWSILQPDAAGKRGMEHPRYVTLSLC